MDALHAIRKVLAMPAAVALLVPTCLIDLGTTPLWEAFQLHFNLKARSTISFAYDDFVGRRTEHGVDVIATDRLRDGELSSGHWAHHDPTIHGFHSDLWFKQNGPWGPLTHGVRCSFYYYEDPDIPIGTNPEVFEAAAVELKNFGYWTGPLPSQGTSHNQESIHWLGVGRHLVGPLLLITTLWSVKLSIQQVPARRRRRLLVKQLCPTCKYDLSASDAKHGWLHCPECGRDWDLSAALGGSDP